VTCLKQVIVETVHTKSSFRKNLGPKEFYESPSRSILRSSSLPTGNKFPHRCSSLRHRPKHTHITKPLSSIQSVQNLHQQYIGMTCLRKRHICENWREEYKESGEDKSAIESGGCDVVLRLSLVKGERWNGGRGQINWSHHIEYLLRIRNWKTYRIKPLLPSQ
jgi:hypothetical protein